MRRRSGLDTKRRLSHRLDAAFVGDTLFMPDYGAARADFPGGDARTLFGSIRKVLGLPGATRVFVGHDYLPAGRSEYQWETTVAEQRAGNAFKRAWAAGEKQRFFPYGRPQTEAFARASHATDQSPDEGRAPA